MSWFKNHEKLETKIVKAAVKTKDCVVDGVEKNVDGAKELFAKDKPLKSVKKSLLNHDSAQPVKHSIEQVRSEDEGCCSCFR